MSDKEEMISGTKRRQLQEQREDELESYGEPAAKTRRIEHGFVLDNTDTQAWTQEQHSDFVAAIFEIGLKHASPAVILENMNRKVETITSERVKSKLQKYRSSKNKEKSKNEFMEQYSDCLQKIQAIEETTNTTAMSDTGADPVLLRFLEQSACKNNTDPCSLFLSGGDVAGYLTHCVWKENKLNHASSGSSANVATKALDEASITINSVLPTNVLRKGARDYVDNYAGCPMQFPVLTETEKKSSLGVAIAFVAGLFLTMSQHLTRERARAETIGLRSSSNHNTGTAAPDTHSTTDNTVEYNNSKGGANI